MDHLPYPELSETSNINREMIWARVFHYQLEIYFIAHLKTRKGDLEQLVSPDPEVTCIERHEDDNYMLIACDGIYDVMSNEEIVEFINDRFSREEDEANISNTLIDLCLHKVISSMILTYTGKTESVFRDPKIICRPL